MVNTTYLNFGISLRTPFPHSTKFTMIIRYSYTALSLTAIVASLCVPSAQWIHPHELHHRSLHSVPLIAPTYHAQRLTTKTITPALSLTEESEAQSDDSDDTLVKRSTGDEGSEGYKKAQGSPEDGNSVEYTPEQLAMYRQEYRDAANAYRQLGNMRKKAEKEGLQLSQEDDARWEEVKAAYTRTQTVWRRVSVGKPIDRRVHKKTPPPRPPLIQRLISGETTIEKEELVVENPSAASSDVTDEDLALFDRLLGAAEKVKEAQFAKNTAAKEGRSFTSEEREALTKAEDDVEKLSREWNVVREAKGIDAFNPYGVGRSGSGYSDVELNRALSPKEVVLFKALRKAALRYLQFIRDTVAIPVDDAGITEEANQYGLTKAGINAYLWLRSKLAKELEAKTASDQRMNEIQSNDAQDSPEKKTTEVAAGRVTLKELEAVFSQEELTRYRHARKAANGYRNAREAMNKAKKEGRDPTRAELEAHEKAKVGVAQLRRLEREGIRRLIERGMARPEIVAREEANRQRFQRNRQMRRGQKGIKEEREGIDEESSQQQRSKGTKTNLSEQANQDPIIGLKKAEDNLKDKPFQSSSISSLFLSKVNHFVNRLRVQGRGDLWSPYHHSLPEFRIPSLKLAPPLLVP